MARKKKGLELEKDLPEEERFELVTFNVKVHGVPVEVYETEETLEEGKVVQIILKTVDGCTYQGKCIKNGRLVQ